MIMYTKIIDLLANDEERYNIASAILFASDSRKMSFDSEYITAKSITINKLTDEWIPIIEYLIDIDNGILLWANNVIDKTYYIKLFKYRDLKEMDIFGNCELCPFNSNYMNTCHNHECYGGIYVLVDINERIIDKNRIHWGNGMFYIDGESINPIVI